MQRPYWDIYRIIAGRVERQCIRCKQWKPQDALHFYRRKSAAGPNVERWRPICKTCTSEMGAAERAEEARHEGQAPDISWAALLKGYNPK